MNRISPTTCSSCYIEPVQGTQPNTSLALIEILSDFHNKVSLINQFQGQHLKDTSENLDQACTKFLEDLKELFEARKAASAADPIFKSLQYISSFINIAIGTGLCATGVASIVGSVIIATGVFGCIHTTLEVTETYKHIAHLTDDRASQEIIKSYIPALISTSLLLSSALTGTYSSRISTDTATYLLQVMMPMILTSIETSKVVAQGIFDLPKYQAESKKISHEQLKQQLETILEEQQEKLSEAIKSRSSLTRETLAIIKTLSSLFKQS